MKNKITNMKFLFTTFVLFLLNASLFAQSEITFTKSGYDFGTIKEDGGKVEYVFEFENTGSAPLIVSNVRPSCGCTVPEWTKDPVLPGQKGSI